MPSDPLSALPVVCDFLLSVLIKALGMGLPYVKFTDTTFLRIHFTEYFKIKSQKSLIP